MRIVVHDYSGHPFQVQLARSLAARGHDVLYLHSVRFQTPKGQLAPAPNDPATFRSEGIDIGEPFAKYGFVRRVGQERRYGTLVADRILRERPEAVLSANAPLDAQARILPASRRTGSAFVFWLQDLYSVAIDRFARRRLPLAGMLVGARYTRLERGLLRASDCVVAVTPDFEPVLRSWGVPEARVTVIENWAPVDEVRPLAKDNPWAREHGLDARRVVLYTGTLGLKHDPGLLVHLAAGLRDRPDVCVVVVSEGLGADWLRAHATDHPNLVLLPFQPYERLSEVIASADVALAILDPDAGTYSVPSKVLTYLAAGRPVLAAVPPENLAARTITRAQAGRVVPPERHQVLRAAVELLADPDALGALAGNARAYAVRSFAIGPITERFEALLDSSVAATLSRAAGRDVARIDPRPRS